MIRALIIDDEPYSISVLKNVLAMHHQDVQIVNTAYSVDGGLKLIEQYRNRFDLLFLDIQMPGKDGFCLLQQLDNIEFKVIFITAFDQYAIRAIRFSAIDYLLKPIDQDELKEAMERFKNPQTKHAHAMGIAEIKKNITAPSRYNKIAIPTLKEILFVDTDSILYIESDRNYSNIHFTDKSKLLSSKNIGYYEELLDHKDFFRIHNSYLVNLIRVKKFIRGKTGCLEMENGRTLDISRGRKEELLNILQFKP